MLFSLEASENAQIIQVNDSIFFDAVTDFDNIVQEAESSGEKRVIINLQNAEMICSSAITTLVKHHMSLQKVGRKLIIAGCNEPMLKVMQLLGLTKLMLFAENMTAAEQL